jgi:hypothetical protein
VTRRDEIDAPEAQRCRILAHRSLAVQPPILARGAKQLKMADLKLAIPLRFALPTSRDSSAREW